MRQKPSFAARSDKFGCEFVERATTTAAASPAVGGDGVGARWRQGLFDETSSVPSGVKQKMFSARTQTQVSTASGGP